MVILLILQVNPFGAVRWEAGRPVYSAQTHQINSTQQDQHLFLTQQQQQQLLQEQQHQQFLLQQQQQQMLLQQQQQQQQSSQINQGSPEQGQERME